MLPAFGSAGSASRANTTQASPPRARDIRAPSSRARRARAGRVWSPVAGSISPARSEEHTSELQSQSNLVCRLLLEKKKKHTHVHFSLTRLDWLAPSLVER